MDATNGKLDEFVYNTKRPVDCGAKKNNGQKKFEGEQVKWFNPTHKLQQMTTLV